MVKKVFQSELQAIRKKYKYNRPDDEVLESIYEKAVSIWELMGQHDRALNDVLGSDPNDERAIKYRGEHPLVVGIDF